MNEKIPQNPLVGFLFFHDGTIEYAAIFIEFDFKIEPTCINYELFIVYKLLCKALQNA